MASIENILNVKYGIGILYADPTTILWASSDIEDVEAAKREIKRANRIREKYGRIPVYVPYGHRLF